ncbi:hypothetical protein LOK49_LG01G00165 [Camellia lanceoleosa]|uniref:Uncharacterized protein n=1 Tax=Camellia lanceoleosa TaxID=1840588 RepID=A0ACC0J3H2_9ERIC|nr:hypothetical protein LOK49_LG01G00165 [Camellia lanceoleosa]
MATVRRNQGCLARNLRYERGRSIMSTPAHSIKRSASTKP